MVALGTRVRRIWINAQIAWTKIAEGLQNADAERLIYRRRCPGQSTIEHLRSTDVRPTMPSPSLKTSCKLSMCLKKRPTALLECKH